MEDDRGSLVVNLAGYPREMEEMSSANSGVRSRLQQTLDFADYEPDELAANFDVIAAREHWRRRPSARAPPAASGAPSAADRRLGQRQDVRAFFGAVCAPSRRSGVGADAAGAGAELDLIELQDVVDARDVSSAVPVPPAGRAGRP